MTSTALHPYLVPLVFVEGSEPVRIYMDHCIFPELKTIKQKKVWEHMYFIGGQSQVWDGSREHPRVLLGCGVGGGGGRKPG
jgi:hypothetical protein